MHYSNINCYGLLEQRIPVDVVYLAIRTLVKALTLFHTSISSLATLQAYDICGDVYIWLYDYLTERK